MSEWRRRGSLKKANLRECGTSFLGLRKGEVLAYVGSIQNLKDLEDKMSSTCATVRYRGYSKLRTGTAPKVVLCA